MTPHEKVYLAGPITGNLEHYHEAFGKAEDLMVKEGYIVLNSATNPVGLPPSDYMRISFAMIEASDFLVLLDNWEDNNGARLERAYAEYIGKPCMDIAHFRPPIRVDSIKAKKPISRVERMFGKRENWPQKAAKPSAQSQSYKGFLMMQCGECGEIKGFCVKVPITHYHCNSCGHDNPLSDLLPANVECKCGRRYKYLTNITTQDTVPFNCLGCGNPVDLILNKRGTAYVTIGAGEERHG